MCQAVVYVTLVVTILLQLKHVKVVGSVPIAFGRTIPTGKPGGGGGILEGCIFTVAFVTPSGWG